MPRSLILTLISLASATGWIFIPHSAGSQPLAQQPLPFSLSLLSFLKFIHAVFIEITLDAGITLDLGENSNEQERQGSMLMELKTLTG